MNLIPLVVRAVLRCTQALAAAAPLPARPALRPARPLPITSRRTLPVLPARRTLALTAATLALVAATAPQAGAQLRLDVSGVGSNQLPIAVADFAGSGAPFNVAELIRSDLAHSGVFRMITTPLLSETRSSGR